VTKVSRAIVALILAASGADVWGAPAARVVNAFGYDAPALSEPLGHAQSPAEIQSSGASARVRAHVARVTPSEGRLASSVAFSRPRETSPFSPVGDRSIVAPVVALTPPGRAPPLGI